MNDCAVSAAANRISKTGGRGRRSSDRRAAIIAALKRCMIDKGYAETTLTDLASATDMSVSHLLYYYPSKEQVLLDLCDELNARILADITQHRGEPPEERIHLLADNHFIRGALTRAELGIVLEIVALAMHRPNLKARLRAFDIEMIAYLEDLFGSCPGHAGLSANDAAQIAGALWMGLQNNVQFDKRLSEANARRLFRQTLLSLANLDGSPAISRWVASASTARKKTRRKSADAP